VSTPEYFYYLADDFYFRRLRESDLDGRWADWFNDPEVTRYQAKGYERNTKDKQRQYFETISASTTDVVLAIADRATGLHLGNVGLHKIDPIHRTAVLGIVIGEKQAWGKGIGRRSWKAITDYAFEKLLLHKVCATVIDGNEASLKCALAAGYVIEGRQAEQIYKPDGYRDLIHVGLLRTHWKR
jgi:ribosomal-protein-alanine N-acetyltransferase